MGATYLEEMNAILAEKRRQGKGGIRLFAKDGRDVSSEDIAHDFVKIERARKTGQLVASCKTSLNF